MEAAASKIKSFGAGTETEEVDVGAGKQTLEPLWRGDNKIW